MKKLGDVLSTHDGRVLGLTSCENFLQIPTTNFFLLKIFCKFRLNFLMSSDSEEKAHMTDYSISGVSNSNKCKRDEPTNTELAAKKQRVNNNWHDIFHPKTKTKTPKTKTPKPKSQLPKVLKDKILKKVQSQLKY